MFKKISWTARKGWKCIWNLHKYFRPQDRMKHCPGPKELSTRKTYNNFDKSMLQLNKSIQTTLKNPTIQIQQGQWILKKCDKTQWEKEQPLNWAELIVFFQPKIGATILKSESVLSWCSQLFYSICRSSWKGRFGERSWHEINFLYFRNISWKEPLEMKLKLYLI